MSWDKIETKYKCDCGKGFKYRILRENDFFEKDLLIIFTCYECYKNYKQPSALSVYRRKEDYESVCYDKNYKKDRS